MLLLVLVCAKGYSDYKVKKKQIESGYSDGQDGKLESVSVAQDYILQKKEGNSWKNCQQKSGYTSMGGLNVWKRGNIYSGTVNFYLDYGALKACDYPMAVEITGGERISKTETAYAYFLIK